jgi:hypothetical protein
MNPFFEIQIRFRKLSRSGKTMYSLFNSDEFQKNSLTELRWDPVKLASMSIFETQIRVRKNSRKTMLI